MALPRVITVDPTWTLARLVRSSIDLLNRPIIQVDVPNSAAALEEMARGCTLMLATFDVDDGMKGFELAMRVKRDLPDSAVIILGDEDDPDEFDEETTADSPFVYLSRPVDVHKFLRVLVAGLEGRDMHAALKVTAGASPILAADMGVVPSVDVNAAQTIIDALLVDLGAMAIILATRTGEVLLERGAVGYLNREQLANALKPAVLSNIDMKDIVGGQISTVQFYDGDDYDVFVLSVGFHHFMCAVFDGQMGSRQFGVVNRFGRRATEDLIAIIGANAFFFQAPALADEERHTPKRKAEKVVEEELLPLARANEALEVAAAEPEPLLQLEPIDNLNLDDLFGTPVEDANFDDLFDPSELQEMANNNVLSSKGKLDLEKAEEIGLIPKLK